MGAKRVTYITTLDGRVPVEWWEKEHFRGRSSGVYSADNVEDLLSGRNLTSISVIPIPDNVVLCDFCNERIEEFPVPVVSNYAVCKECFKNMQKKEVR